MKKLLTLLTLGLYTVVSNAQFEEFIWDTLEFETAYEHIEMNEDSTDLWQLGKPNKVFLDSAFSPINGMITDTVALYPPNNHSYFDLKIGQFNVDWYPYNIYVDFKHKMDSDTLLDGGYVSISLDYGASFYNVLTFPYFDDTINPMYWDGTPEWDNENSYNEFDSLTNDEFGFSGRFDWKTSVLNWYLIPVGPQFTSGDQIDTMIVRFNFISDSIDTQKEGWLIDDLRLYSVDFGGSIDEPNASDFSIQPNPVTYKSKIVLDRRYSSGKLQLFSSDGQIVKEIEEYNVDRFELNHIDVPPGFYVLRVIGDGNLIGNKRIIFR